MKPVNKRGCVYRNAFYEVFKSAQLSGAYTIYYDMDFSKEELQEFSNKLEEHNNEEINHNIHLADLRNFALEKYQFDGPAEAYKFPYRAKLKMYGKKTTPKSIIDINVAATDALECYMLLVGYTLHTDYGFTKDQFMKWYEKFVDFCKLYSDGLTDEHVLEYFIQECNLTIKEED